MRPVAPGRRRWWWLGLPAMLAIAVAGAEVTRSGGPASSRRVLPPSSAPPTTIATPQTRPLPSAPDGETAAPAPNSTIPRRRSPSPPISPPRPGPSSGPDAPVVTSRPSGKLVPARGTLFGSYVNGEGVWIDNAFAQKQVSVFESRLGRNLDINHHFYSWTNAFPTDLERSDLENGRIPLISWAGTSLDTILSGHADEMIQARADALKSLGQPVFLRWGWEMNGSWMAWSGASNNTVGQTDGPAKYVAAWRKIHDVFTARGATNVVWVWSPNAFSVPFDAWNAASNYYPGDNYVDWVGLDGYNQGGQPSAWRSFSSIFTHLYEDYAGRKPIMIAETASSDRGGDKAMWFSEAREAIKTTMTSVAALVYFHEPKEADWRADSTPAAFEEFKAMAGDSWFNPR